MPQEVFELEKGPSPPFRNDPPVELLRFSKSKDDDALGWLSPVDFLAMGERIVGEMVVPPTAPCPGSRQVESVEVFC